MYRPAELEPEVHPRTLLADHRTRRGTAGLDRVAGLEPTPLPCIGSALPLSYTRLGNIPNILCAELCLVDVVCQGPVPQGNRIWKFCGNLVTARSGVLTSQGPAPTGRPSATTPNRFTIHRTRPGTDRAGGLAPRAAQPSRTCTPIASPSLAIPASVVHRRSGASPSASSSRAVQRSASRAAPRSASKFVLFRPGRGQANCRPGIARCTRRRGSGRPKGRAHHADDGGGSDGTRTRGLRRDRPAL